MNPPAGQTPEQLAREQIDAMLEESGWAVQDRDQMNVFAAQGVAVREFKLKSGHGFADYLLFVDAKSVGVLEAKKVGHTLSGVEVQAKKYATGLPDNLSPPVRPLPFLYLSTGVVTKFTNLLDPHPRSRRVFAVHRPGTLAEWLRSETLSEWSADWAGNLKVAEGAPSGGYGEQPSTLRTRLQALPELHSKGLWDNQLRAIQGLEASLREDRPRSLVQMATGSGKTWFAVTALYRLIKFGGARRVLFLVDRGNLGEQAEKEFEGFRTPDDNRKFNELYNVQRLTSQTIGASSKVVICTIQRLYSILKGEPEYEGERDEGSQFLGGEAAGDEPLPVVYNRAIPPEFFDVIVVDECHRSIYSLWRQVLEYFDAYLIGLTATPAKHTFGFFNQNLVMEYGHDRAVADGVNVDFEVYRIRTKITAVGSTIEATDEPILGIRDRQTRQLRWQAADEDVTYGATDLDRNVVARDQIRLIVRTFKERLFTEIFPGRTEVPKTLIFAKDDSHAEDIVEIVREEFGRGNEFCQKITYKTTGEKPKTLIQAFRNSYNPRIAVTVDMIATGTDIKPIEIVVFMRSVRSRLLFEQMKGRGVRVIKPDEMQAVTPDARVKTHFMIVDCVGVTETEMADTQPLERKKHASFKSLLEHVAAGGTDPDVVSSLASRLSRLDRKCGPEERQRIEDSTGGTTLADITGSIIDALDPDRQHEEARCIHDLADDQQPTEDQVLRAGESLVREAVMLVAANPDLRNLLVETKTQLEQIIDIVSRDELLEAGVSADAREKARAMVTSFRQFLEDNRDEIDALQFFYSQPYAERLRYRDIKQLAEAIKAPPHSWTPEALWRAYELLEKDRVRGASSSRLLTDVVSLVRFALEQDDELVPYGDQVRQRFDEWMAQQANQARFNEDQTRWLEMISDHIATSLQITVEDFGYTPFIEEGGLGRAASVFGKELGSLLRELIEVLVA